MWYIIVLNPWKHLKRMDGNLGNFVLTFKYDFDFNQLNIVFLHLLLGDTCWQSDMWGLVISGTSDVFLKDLPSHATSLGLVLISNMLICKYVRIGCGWNQTYAILHCLELSLSLIQIKNCELLFHHDDILIMCWFLLVILHTYYFNSQSSSISISSSSWS